MRKILAILVASILIAANKQGGSNVEIRKGWYCKVYYPRHWGAYTRQRILDIDTSISHIEVINDKGERKSYLWARFDKEVSWVIGF